jgi:hypothetical protein
VKPEQPEWAENLLKAVEAKWREHAVHLGSGYSVFYSPVEFGASISPRVLIVGLNPGGSTDADTVEARQIPSEHGYITYGVPMHPLSYLLAKQMRRMFERAHLLCLLAGSVKINLLFFRTKDLSDLGRLPFVVRRDLEEFCKGHVREIVNRLKPEVVLAEGMATYDSLLRSFFTGRPSEVVIQDGQARIYCRAATAEGEPRLLIGLIHPSGGRTRRRFDDKIDQIVSELRNDLQPSSRA